MEQHHRKLINDNLLKLSNYTIDTESIINQLFERGVINDWMKNDILKFASESDRNTELYQVIQGRGPNAFTDLCMILNDTSNTSALNILTKNNQELTHTQISEHDSDTFYVSDINDLNDDGSYVKIHPERQRMDINEENLPTGAYPMGSNPKGHALILNMNKIINYEDRIGSNVDVENLQKLFECLGYVVQSKVDLTKIEFIKTIQEFTRICHCEITDSIVVFIMSHGEAGENASRSSDILTTDGNKINTDWIIEQFGPEKISINIPKLFFIQACRGQNRDLGWISFDNGNSRVQNDSVTTSNTNHYEIETTSIRRYENIFIAHATVPGYGAKRDQIDGSWFVQKLCKVIRGNAWKFDLDSMMKMVDMEIKKLNSVQHGFQTVEWTYRGFNKKFYFNPGLYDDNCDYDASRATSVKPVNT